MTNNLAQRAADELNVECGGTWTTSAYAPTTLQTTMRLLARIDELEARTKRRSEPMPEPVPEWLRRLSVAEMQKDLGPKLTSVWPGWTIARMIWERGDAEPVDPLLLIEAREIVINDGTDRTEHQKAVIRTHSGTNGKVALALAALKRGMELQKEIG